MLKKIAISAMVTLMCSHAALAEDFASRADAEAMVAKAISAIAADREGTFKEITGQDKKWVYLDLYPMVYDMNGTCVAHGQNPRQVGKDLMGAADADGKEFVKERVQRAAAEGKFWQDYKFRDPVSKRVLPKEAYCEKSADVIVCSGVYKR